MFSNVIFLQFDDGFQQTKGRNYYLINVVKVMKMLIL